ncbi:MAG: Rne/Rng family ribonuclease [Gammaproteobacteria bacterium]|nr:Rne/Rng family ribonuclease [Gammaproteobacteria bacterium]
MKRMMINATQSEELRVAIADGQKLLDLDIETPAHEQKKANIYKAKITRVERSLEACFVDYGVPRHGFLPFKEINPDALILPADQKRSGNIKDLLKEGQELIVQVEKEERGTKGAALSTYISLAGRYSVLMPNNPGGGGVSRRISGPERNELRDLIDQLNLPEEMGLIIRTAGMGREIAELQWDIDYLVQLWEAIKKAADEHKAPLLIYQESNLFIRALRDYLRDDIAEILVDDQNVYNKAVEFMQMVMPHNLRKLKHYDGETPLFTRFQIESQIETAFAREVRLPSGGALVIDHTEALLSIDINSARATKGADIEETALQTNLEAADEIARQLKIRDLGGLIVIDFIDMSKRSAQRKVEERLNEALKSDRARIQTGRISRFGLLEMSRQRMRPSLGDSSYQTCPRCLGSGSIRSIESLALSILRLLEEEALKDNTGQIQVQVPVTVANFMLNEKRQAIQVIEKRHNVSVLLLSNPGMETPQYEIKRLRANEVEDVPSYEQVKAVEPDLTRQTAAQAAVSRPKPVVDRIQPAAPAPVRKTAKSGWLQSLFAFFAGNGNDDDGHSTGDGRGRSRAAGPGRQHAADDASSGHAGGGKKTRSKKKTGKKTAQKSGQSSGQASAQSSSQSGSGNADDDANRNNEQGAGRGKKRRGKKGSKKAAVKADTGSPGNQSQEAASGAQENASAGGGGEGSGENKPRRRGKRGGRRRRSRQEGAAESGNSNQQSSGQSKTDQTAGGGDDSDQGGGQGKSAQGKSAQGKSDQGKSDQGKSDQGQDNTSRRSTSTQAADKAATDKPSVDTTASVPAAAPTAKPASGSTSPISTGDTSTGVSSAATAAATARPAAQSNASKAPSAPPAPGTEATQHNGERAGKAPSEAAATKPSDSGEQTSAANKAIPDGPKGLYVLPAEDGKDERSD